MLVAASVGNGVDVCWVFKNGEVVSKFSIRKRNEY